MTTREKLTTFISLVAILASVSIACIGWIRADRGRISDSEHAVITAAVTSETASREAQDEVLEKKLDGIQSTLESVKTSSDKTRGMVETILDLMDGKLISGR